MKPIIRIAITTLLVAAILGIGIVSRRGRNEKNKDEAAEMITGTDTDGGNKIKAGVLIFASTGIITDPPPVLFAKTPPASILYTTVSGADGKYSLAVRASRSSYNMRAFYSVPDSNNRTFSTTSKTRSGIIVNKDSKVSDQNFTWP